MSECLPCKALTCEPNDDFAVYNLQNPDAQNPSTETPTGPACEPCKSLTCETAPDLEIYSLQTGIVFNGVPLSGIAPDGTIITYPPGTFVVNPPPPRTPPDTVFYINGCIGPIAYVNTPASIAAALAQLAQQQAQCGDDSGGGGGHPPPQPPPTTFYNQAVYFSHVCPGGQKLYFTGASLPGWITVDQANSRLVGAPGTFTGATQAAANSQAQSALNSFGNAAVASGGLDCRAPFANTLQSIGCPAGSSDIHHYNHAIDETGVYAVNGTFYTAPQYYFSDISQADADDQALTAAAEARDDAIALDLVRCVDDCLLQIDWGDAVTSASPGYTATHNAAQDSASINLSEGGCVNLPPNVPNSLGSITVSFAAVLPKCMDGKTLQTTIAVIGTPTCTRAGFSHQTICLTKLNVTTCASATYSEPVPGSGASYNLSDNSSNVVPATSATVETNIASGAQPVTKGQTGIVFTVNDATGFAIGNPITVAGAGLFTITGLSGNQITATYINDAVNGARAIANGAAVVRRTTYNTVSFSLQSQNFGVSVAATLSLGV